MDHSQKRKRRARRTRVMRVRKSVRGSSDKPRLSISKSNRHLYVQLIDDQKGVTLCGLGTLKKTKQGIISKSKESAKLLGAELAKIAKEKNVQTVIFDRGRYKFHGLVAELANGAREAGLQF